MSQPTQGALVRKLPPDPNLKQIRKQAKDLLKALQAGDAVAVAEVRAHLHGPLPEAGGEGMQLSTVQFVLARAYGFESWPKLKAFVDGVTIGKFVEAVKSGDLERVRRMVRQRPELVHMDTAENDEHRGLHYAVVRRDVPMARLLMQAGADARKGIFPHRDATTAITLAKEREYTDVVAAIEEAEQQRRQRMSCPNASVSPAQDEINAAILAGDDARAVRLLEADRSLIRACDRSGGTSLHAAAQRTNAGMVTWLLARSANPRKRDLAGLTPLDRAALAADPRNDRASQFPAVAKLLLDRGAEVTLHAAVALADGQRLGEMLRRDPGLVRRDIDWSRGGLLSLAVKHGHLEIVRLLLDLGADPDERILLSELEEPTPSWGAPLWYAALAGRRDIAELLLDRGADPNANVYASGWPLRNAYQRHDEALKRLLIDRGAKPQPYMVADAHDVTEAKRLLAMDPGEELVRELTWSAAVNGCPAIVELALPQLTWQADDPWWHWILIQPIRGMGDNSGLRPAATTKERLACLAILLRHRIDVNVSRLGQTVLHFIAAHGAIEHEADRVRFAAMLLDAGAKLDLRDDLLRSTPLGWACRWGRGGMVDLLIGRGAPVSEPEAEAWATPLAWARRLGHTTIERRLHDLGAKA